jgi:hypothetical protein
MHRTLTATHKRVHSGVPSRSIGITPAVTHTEKKVYSIAHTSRVPNSNRTATGPGFHTDCLPKNNILSHYLHDLLVCVQTAIPRWMDRVAGIIYQSYLFLAASVRVYPSCCPETRPAAAIKTPCDRHQNFRSLLIDGTGLSSRGVLSHIRQGSDEAYDLSGT